MNTAVPTALTGKHVELLPMKPEHASGIYEAGKNADIWTYTQGRIATLDEAKEYIRKALEQTNAIPFVIYHKQLQKIVGCTRFYEISTTNKSLEIGSTWLAPEVWRTSINTECKYLLLRHCFETLGTIRVQLKTDLRNTRSQQAIERLGAIKEGILRNHMILADGYVRDSVMYSIIDKDWNEVKERLERFMA